MLCIMRMIKFTHACVRLENEGRALVLDPGTFSEAESLDGAEAVLVTHEHVDHLDAGKLRAAAATNPDLRVWTHEGIAATLPDLNVTVVAPGDEFEAAGMTVRVFGGRHALIHGDLPRVANVAFLVENVLHPGDSFTVPELPVDTLLTPLSAPWMKLAEAADFTRAVRPRRAFPIHDGLLNSAGHSVMDGSMRRLVEPHGVEYTRLEPGESTVLD